MAFKAATPLTCELGLCAQPTRNRLKSTMRRVTLTVSLAPCRTPLSRHRRFPQSHNSPTILLSRELYAVSLERAPKRNHYRGICGGPLTLVKTDNRAVVDMGHPGEPRRNSRRACVICVGEMNTMLRPSELRRCRDTGVDLGSPRSHFRVSVPFLRNHNR